MKLGPLDLYKPAARVGTVDLVVETVEPHQRDPASHGRFQIATVQKPVAGYRSTSSSTTPIGLASKLT